MIIRLLESLRRPDEIRSLYLLKVSSGLMKKEKRPIDELAKELDDLAFCYAVLGRVSRSFASVIKQLPVELRDAVCIFYLVLRGLDSIEDDTSVSKEEREILLKSFHLKHNDASWSTSGIGDSQDYRKLLENYTRVIGAFQNLRPSYQNVILEITEEMGDGMAKFLRKEMTTVEDYNEYCGYVAGLVGVGLSKLFSESGLEKPEICHQKNLAYSMGLFLQKTNIIRDYHEDQLADRNFWPDEIWKQYGNSIDDFIESDSPEALNCLNHLITDALSHASDCLEYLRKIRHENVFRFCAIPQVMAIATLAEIYNNPRVFRENIKIRKGLTARLIIQTKNFDDACDIFEEMALKIFNKLSIDDPNSYLTAIYLRGLVNKKSKITEIDLFSKDRSLSDKHAMAS